MKESKKYTLSDEKILKTFLEVAPEPIYFKDEKDRFTKVSKSFENWFEINGEEIIGKESADFFPQNQEEKTLDDDERITLEKENMKGDIRKITISEGEERWVLVNEIPFTEDYENEGMIGILRDITKLKRAKDRLGEVEERYQKTIENANVGVGVYGDDKDMRLLNETMEDIIGYDKEDTPTLGQWFKKLYPDHEERMDVSKLWFEEIAKDGQISGIETDITRSDGEERTLLFNAVQLESGDVVFIFFAEDITELVEAREKLTQKKEELEQKKKELEAFVYTVSHDLRTPLISLEGFSHMLLDDYADELGEEGQHYLDRIQANVEKMDNFIDDLLQLSRVGRKETDKEEVSVGEVVQEVLDDLSSRLDEEGVEVEVDEEMPSIYFERKRMYQIFSNFISNACKYMGDQEEPRIRIGSEDKDDAWLLWVEDNGIGIESENQEEIFEIFNREERIDQKGTGVGLSIVNRIVEHHDGEIWVESEKGEGSTFYVEFPKQETENSS